MIDGKSSFERINLHTTEICSEGLPSDLESFIRTARSLGLPRHPFYIPNDSIPPDHVLRVSPKKLHEVFTMSSYVASLFADLNQDQKPWIVDVGAGQGYLSRSLSAPPNNFHVLALDSNDNQTAGAISRRDWLDDPKETRSSNNHSNLVDDNPNDSPNESGGVSISEATGSLTHRTVHIGDNDSLFKGIKQWIDDRRCGDVSGLDTPIPIVLVGLHCCGDLTPSVLRFIRQYRRNDRQTSFRVIGCVIVGCCYNMCGPSSFHLSQNMTSAFSTTGSLSLETQHLHLATQSPSTWDITTSVDRNPPGSPFSFDRRVAELSPTALAIRKVAYRALLARRLPLSLRVENASRSTPADNSELGTMKEGFSTVNNLRDIDWRSKRIGRLANSAYVDFPTYLGQAKRKLKLDAEVNCDLNSDLNVEEQGLCKVLEVFHVLRCFLGPVIESLIVLDRYWFLEETAEQDLVAETNNRGAESSEGRGTDGSMVQLVNLFDQSTGSLRNMALIWKE
ncbi:hypothetical protein FRB91_004245 [Serendipita sp. 411]|nr:hypothetical protein FRB91_004245 [Serendipita sp. 411]